MALPVQSWTLKRCRSAVGSGSTTTMCGAARWCWTAASITCALQLPYDALLVLTIARARSAMALRRMASIYPKSVAGHSMTFNKEWLTDAAIAHAVATAPEGPFTLTGPLPLPYHNKSSGKPGYFWDRIAMNPKFLRAADGTWLLYYTGAGYGGPMPPDPAANLSWWTVRCRRSIGPRPCGAHHQPPDLPPIPARRSRPRSALDSRTRRRRRGRGLGCRNRYWSRARASGTVA